MFEKKKPRKCRACKTEFQPRTQWQKYCSDRCRMRVKNRKRTQLVRWAKKIVKQHEARSASLPSQ